MGYSHIGSEERRRIARLLKEGRSARQIAASLDRSPSTASRKVNRNRLTSCMCKPAQANEKAQAAYQGRRIQRRDILVMGGSAGVTSLFWLLVEFGLRLGLSG